MEALQFGAQVIAAETGVLLGRPPEHLVDAVLAGQEEHVDEITRFGPPEEAQQLVHGQFLRRQHGAVVAWFRVPPSEVVPQVDFRLAFIADDFQPHERGVVAGCAP